ncbi:MAG: Uncharacterised protein [SAR116 cluster bacterium]|nr:MAG: Uncharacterised protein [SAR116 cluster bacterium]
MKKLFFLFSIFSIVLSCSSDETSTPVTPPPAPIVKYTITLSAGEGGTVSTTGGEFEAGQTVSVTATPQGEYLFKDWSDGNTDATRTITVSSNTTLTANFEKRKYPLTVNIEGEGEVLEEIVNTGRTTDYDSGTTVKLTAVPAEGWEFVGWKGAIESTELEVQLLVSEAKEINAEFKISSYSIKISKVNLLGLINSIGGEYDAIDTNVSFNSGFKMIYFTSSDEEFLISAGHANCIGRSDGNDIECDIQNIYDTKPQSSIIFKKINDEWTFHSIEENAKMWAMRNFDIEQNSIAMSDANEIGQGPWMGPLIYGEHNNGEFVFTEVTPFEEYSFYHDVSLGDLNMDGLMDVVGTTFYGPNLPGGKPDTASLGLFIQTSNKAFEMRNDLIEYPILDNGLSLFQGVPLGVSVTDLFGDKRPEIVAYFKNELRNSNEYLGINLFNNPIVIFEYDEEKEKYIPFFNDFNIIETIYQVTSIDVEDINNDGIMDIIVSMEGSPIGDILDVWIGTENKKFIFKKRMKKDGDVEFMDVNSDGYLDMVKRGQVQLLYENQQLNRNGQWCPSYPGDPDCTGYIERMKKSGVNIKKLIYINDGFGNFNEYPIDLIIYNIASRYLIPYKKNGKLHFLGTSEFMEDDDGVDANRFIKYGLDINVFEYTINDIEINVFN